MYNFSFDYNTIDIRNIEDFNKKMIKEFDEKKRYDRK